MRTYQIARRALENLFNEVNTVALGRRTDRGFQAINGEITGWCPRLCYRKISPLGSVIPATTAFIWVSSGDRMVRDAHAGF
jgi:hypothetical protein